MTVNQKIEFHLNLARLAQIDGNDKKYKREIREIRRLTKEKEAK